MLVGTAPGVGERARRGSRAGVPGVGRAVVVGVRSQQNITDILCLKLTIIVRGE